MSDYFISFAILFLPLTTAAQTTPAQLIGRWEVIRYSEQGVQVDKKQAALPQAQAVYAHVGSQRAAIWYGYDETTGERPPRRFERWEERDSIAEVRRVAKAIAMPYFAVFFCRQHPGALQQRGLYPRHSFSGSAALRFFAVNNEY